MVYIKVENEVVYLGGTVATEEMIEEGWFKYDGEIPILKEFEYFEYIDNKLVVVEDTKTKLEKQSIEADAYLKSTDWIEPYIIKHELKIELIKEDSSKWQIINKRAECKAFLKVNK